METEKEVIQFDFAEKKYGRDGEPMDIQSNFFKINLKKEKIYHYAINIQFSDIIGDKTDRNVPQRNKLLQQKKIIDKSNFAIFDKFIMQEARLFSSKPIYDGNKSVYSKTKINFEKTITVQVKQKVPEKKWPQTFDIILTVPKINHIVDLSVLNDSNVVDAFNEIQALNTILSCGFRKKKLVIGSNIFYRKADIADLPSDQRANSRFELGQLKQGSFGHHQAVKFTERGIQLNVDRSVIVFNKSGKIIPLIEEICTELRSRGGGRGRFDNRECVRINDNFQLSFKERKFLNDEFKNIVFESDHITFRPRNKIYCFTEKTVSQITFEQKLQNGDVVKVSVKNYFEKTYKDYIEQKLGGRGLNPNLPCIQVNKINPKFIPLEVCYIVDDQYFNKKLNPILQSEMTKKFSIQKPTQRFKESRDHIKNLIELSRTDEFDFLSHFNLSLENECTVVKGRLLANPSLLFKTRDKPTYDGQWKIDDKFFQPAGEVGKNWMVVNFTEVYKEPIRFCPKGDVIDSFIRTFLNVSSNFGVSFDKPCKTIYDERFGGLLDLEDAFVDYLKINKNLKLIVFFIPKNDDLYNKIKYLSELKFGVMTQCVSQEKQRNFTSNQYVSNLLLKVNAKLGGINFTLQPSHKVGFLKKKTMIMGLDVTHPSRHDKMANSIASVVATYDSKMINYVSKCVVQPSPRLEIVKLDEIMFEMLNNFIKTNNFAPDFIVMYRDGVSESQFNEVINKELKLMKLAFSRIDPKYSPKLTFIVVQKRHHVRFLPVNPRNRLNSENVKPGTVIDNTIVSNYYHEYFLCAHFGALGTSRPTRYIVLHDESEFSGDEIQRATNNLSYLFPRCLKAVSVPPPVLYAHLAAKRARSYLITLDNNRGIIWGENQLEQNEIDDLINKIKVKNNFEKILYYV